MNHLVGQGFSQRLACRVAGLSRSAYCRTRAAGGAKTLRDHGPVRQWMNDFAATHRRWGYKRAWVRAKSEGVVVGRVPALVARRRAARAPAQSPQAPHCAAPPAPGQG